MKMLNGNPTEHVDKAVLFCLTLICQPCWVQRKELIP